MSKELEPAFSHPAMRVSYRSLLKSGRRWDAIFDVGDPGKNAKLALSYAHKHCAEVTRVKIQEGGAK